MLLDELADRLGDRRHAAWVLEAAEAQAPEEVAARAHALVDRRLAGEPLQYVLGSWSFRTLELTVDRRVLIPRPETEQVVEVALSLLASTGTPARCLDLGTGSGAIACSLAAEAPARRGGTVEVWAVERSTDALAVARANADHAALSVSFAEGSWFDPLPSALRGTFDLIVANPPYVAEAELSGLDSEVRDWEPIEALVAPVGAAGVAGMADIETIIAGAGHWLRPDGVLVVEIAPSQAYASIDVARRAGFVPTVERDLAGRLRVLVARRRP